MQRLVSTTGCPTIDAELAVYADVVLRWDGEEIVLLRYSPRFRHWYVCGCVSVNASARNPIPEAGLYWCGTGYLDDAAYLYAFFDEKPLHAYEAWNDFYDIVAQRGSLRRPSSA